MKRFVWAMVMSAVAIGGGLTAPTPALAGAPCHLHECHNDLECEEDFGCLNGCNRSLALQSPRSSSWWRHRALGRQYRFEMRTVASARVDSASRALATVMQNVRDSGRRHQR